MGAATWPLRDDATALATTLAPGRDVHGGAAAPLTGPDGDIRPDTSVAAGVTHAAVLVREIAWLEPAEAFTLWAGSDGLAFLDSAGLVGARSRFSYLCVEPFRTLRCGADGPLVPGRASGVAACADPAAIRDAADGGVSVDGVAVHADPFTALEAELRRFRLPPGAGPLPFCGGAVGLLGYGLGRWLERLPCRHPDDLDIPDASIGFYDLVLGFDRAERRAWVMSSGFPETDPARRAARAAARAESALRRLAGPRPGAAVPSTLPQAGEWRAELDRAGYEDRVREAQALIRAGDIFEVNVSMRHRAARAVPPDAAACTDEAVHLALRAASANPFGAFLRCGPRLAVASASPERFLHLDTQGWVETRPIKGTRPRGATPEADAALRLELAASEKDRAENLMIVDLMRNDLGRVCRIGSVSVPALWNVETFSSVHHLVSVVRGCLREGLGAVDLLRATFPGGSVTGAPKVRALEVIDALESSRRGPYCGAVVAIGFDGAMDSSIVIRTLVLTPEVVLAQAGGAVVSDSDPGDEYDEMITKVSPLLHVFGK
jgi:para-aminobenzoate synthetase component 1